MKGKEIRILTLLAIDTVFFLIEIIAGKKETTWFGESGNNKITNFCFHIGYAVHSLALVADSFHMVSIEFLLLCCIQTY